ncbi:O-antigen ligase family protein [bacterium]|nr:O-antigen ligase family protein [bacterium]
MINSDSGAMMAMGRGWLSICVLVGAVAWLSVRRWFSPAEVKWGALLSAVSILGLISAYFSVSPHAAFLEAVGYIAAGVLLLLTGNAAREVYIVSLKGADNPEKDSPFIVKGLFVRIVNILSLVLTAVILCSWGIYWGTGHSSVAMGGSFYQNNMFACFLLLNLPLIMGRLLQMSEKVDFENGGDIKAVWDSYLYYVLLLSALFVSLYMTYNRSAWVCGALGVFAVSGFWAVKKGKRALWTAVAALLGTAAFTAFLFLIARAAWLGLGFLLVSLACLFYIVFRSLNTRYLWVSALSAVILSGIFLSLLIPSVEEVKAHNQERLQGIATQSDTSMQARKQFYRAGWQIFLSHPGLGVGPGNFELYYPQYQSDMRWFSKRSHSLTLDILSEGGLAVFALFCILGASIFIFVIRGAFKEPCEIFIMRLGCLTGAGLLLIHAQIDVDFHVIILPMYGAMLLGVSYGLPFESQDGPAASCADYSEEKRGSIFVNFILAALIAAAALQAVLAWPGQYYATSAKLLDNEGRNREAALCWLQAANSDPKMGEYWRQVGVNVINGHLGEDEKERNYLLDLSSSQAALLDPGRASALGLRGQVLENTGRFQEALDMALRALALDAKNYPVYYAVCARSYLCLGKAEEAREILDRAFAIFDFERLSCADIFDFRLGNMKRSLSECYLIRYNLAKHQQDPEACKYLSKALILDAELGEAYIEEIKGLVQEGCSLRDKGKLREAAETFSRAEQLLDELYAADSTSKSVRSLWELLPAMQPHP